MNDKEKEKKKIKSRYQDSSSWLDSLIGCHTFITQTVAVIITDTAAILRIESPNDLLSIGVNPEIA